MADVISVTNSDSAFDASKGVTRTNLPPFAQRLRKAADLVWEEGYRQPFTANWAKALCRARSSRSICCRISVISTTTPECMLWDWPKQTIRRSCVHAQRAERRVECGVDRAPHVSGQLRHHRRADEQRAPVAFARAYTSNILSIAYGKDILDILVAVLPCAWVYADYGYRLAHEFADTLDVNQYKSWVDMYKTDEFWQGSAWLIEHIEKLAAEVSEERKQELVDIFVTGVENEYMFWSSAYDMQYTWKPNGIRRADSPARSLPIVYFHMKRPAFRLVSEGGPLLI